MAKAGLPFDVKHGDRFRCGPHLLQCGDLTVPQEWELLLRAWRKHSRKPIGWIYTDPPWNAGNLRWWRNLAGYDAPKQDYSRFASRVVECAGMLSPQAVYTEVSVRDPNTVLLAAASCPAWPNLAGRYTVRYGAPVNTGDHVVECKRPNLLLRFSNREWAGDPTELAGQKMTEHVFDHEPCALEKQPVADLCVGKGMTVRVAHARGIACLGNELNPKRLAVTLEWLARKGVEVVKV